MIDLHRVRAILEEAERVVDELDGQDLDERQALGNSQSKSLDRQQRAAMSQALNQLADRLQLASTLVRNEYWVARGASNPLE